MGGQLKRQLTGGSVHSMRRPPLVSGGHIAIGFVQIHTLQLTLNSHQAFCKPRQREPSCRDKQSLTIRPCKVNRAPAGMLTGTIGQLSTRLKRTSKVLQRSTGVGSASVKRSKPTSLLSVWEVTAPKTNGLFLLNIISTWL